ncbi:MAG: hypothetical protein AAFW81_01550 [Pseudomonadota bacterium]
MSFTTRRSFQDIAFIKVEKDGAPGDGGKSKTNWLLITSVVFATVLLILIGYILGVKTGYLGHPQDACCFGFLDLDLDFDFDRDGA